MSLHPSLKRAEKLSATRSVMKRAERIKWLMDKGRWEEDSRVTGLPKIKVIKLKSIKKEKPKEEEDQEAAAAEAETTEPEVTKETKTKGSKEKER